MPYEVFICYANRDREKFRDAVIADAIFNELEKNGITPWMAPRSIISGEDWDKAITKALSQCSVLVLLFSANSNDSDYCINEVNIAFDNKQEIIPVFIDNSSPSGAMQLYLKRKQWLYANTLPVEPHLKRLVDEVKRQLLRTKVRETTLKDKQEAEETGKEKERKEDEAVKYVHESVKEPKIEPKYELRKTKATSKPHGTEQLGETLKSRKRRRIQITLVSISIIVIFAGVVVFVLLSINHRRQITQEPEITQTPSQNLTMDSPVVETTYLSTTETAISTSTSIQTLISNPPPISTPDATSTTKFTPTTYYPPTTSSTSSTTTTSPTITPIPLGTFSKLIIDDDFSNLYSGWDTKAYSNGSYTYENREYSIAVDDKNWSFWSYHQGVGNDCRVSVELKRLSEYGSAGIIFRAQDNLS